MLILTFVTGVRYDNCDFICITFVKLGVMYVFVSSYVSFDSSNIYEPVHEISNNVVCATSNASDQPAHTRSLIRAFATRLSIP